MDNFSRFIVLAPIKNKTASSVAHALVLHLICPYTTPRILLSDNGAEFRNALLAEICNQFITQTFTVAYHPASNGLVERAKRKIIDALRPVVNALFKNSEDWIAQISACLNNSVSESTEKSPHYISYGLIKDYPMIYSLGHRSQSMTLITMQNNNCMYLLKFITRFVKNYKLLGLRRWQNNTKKQHQ